MLPSISGPCLRTVEGGLSARRDALAELLRMVERTGQWPDRVAEDFTSLYPKKLERVQRGSRSFVLAGQCPGSPRKNSGRTTRSMTFHSRVRERCSAAPGVHGHITLLPCHVGGGDGVKHETQHRQQHKKRGLVQSRKPPETPFTRQAEKNRHSERVAPAHPGSDAARIPTNK